MTDIGPDLLVCGVALALHEQMPGRSVFNLFKTDFIAMTYAVFYKLYFVGIRTEAHEMIFKILFL